MPECPLHHKPSHQLSRLSFSPGGRRPSSFPGLRIRYVHRPLNTPLHVAQGSVPNGTPCLLPGKLLFFPSSSPGGNNVFTRCSRNQGNHLSHSFPDPSHPRVPKSCQSHFCFLTPSPDGTRLHLHQLPPASLTRAVTLSIHHAITEPSRLRKSTNLMMP